MFEGYLALFDDVLAEARKSRHVVQMQYLPIYKAVIDYVRGNGLMLSDVETLVRRERSVMSVFAIYGGDISRHANRLANILAGINIYVVMYTTTRGEDYSITVDGNRMVQLYDVHARLAASIVPVVVDGVKMYPPEMELIEVYHRLYLPNYAGEWGGLCEVEGVLRAAALGGGADGGADGGRRKRGRDKKKDRGEGEAQGEKKGGPLWTAAVVMGWLRGRDDCLVVGVNAVNVMAGVDRYVQKFQVVTGGDVEGVVDGFAAMVLQCSGARVQRKLHRVGLATEPRLTKTVVSVAREGGGYTAVLDVFNAATYELVPYTVRAGVKVGHPYVVKMFLLIDLWLVRILGALKLMDRGGVERIAAGIAGDMGRVDEVGGAFGSGGEEYLGVHVDLARFKQKASLENGCYPYYPEQQRYQKGGYRQVS